MKSENFVRGNSSEIYFWQKINADETAETHKNYN